MSETVQTISPWDEGFDKCGIAEEFRNQDDFFFHESPDGILYPIPRTLEIDGEPHVLTESGAAFHKTAEVGPDVSAEGYVLVGQKAKLLGKTSLGWGTEIGKGAKVEDSNVGRESIIEFDSRIECSQLESHVKVEMGASVLDSSIGEKTTIDDSSVVSGSELGRYVRIGSFNKIHSSNLLDDVKSDHHTNIYSSTVHEKVVIEDRVTINHSHIGEEARALSYSFISDETVKPYSIIVPRGTPIKKSTRKKLP